MKKRITILGSTGSIGKQTLDVIQNEPEYFEVIALSAWKNIDLLKEQMMKHRPKYVVVKDDKLARELKNKIPNGKVNCRILYGEFGLAKIASLRENDLIVVALTGMAAFKPTMEAIKSGKMIGLANKEIIVAAGQILNEEIKKYESKIIPIDSEHSGIFQCMRKNAALNIEKIIITASGGPLYHLKESALDSVSIDEAINHPNWDMGEKISVDSATLMNKGLEVIEAHWLFDIPIDKIEVIIHPQSYIHALIQYDDGTVLAQLSEHDMRIPIHFALHYPEKVKNNLPRINLSKIGQLTFKKLDNKRFPSVDLCYDVIKQGGTLPTAMNAANEIAVQAFLGQKIKFKQILGIIQSVIEKHENILNPTIQDIYNQDRESRKLAIKLCDMLKNGH